MLLASVYLGIVLLGWIALAFWDTTWVTFPLLVLFPLSIPIGFVAMGSQAVRLYDIRGLKAEFPRVVAGFSLGFAVGGLAAAALTGPLGAVSCGSGRDPGVGRPAALARRPRPRPGRRVGRSVAVRLCVADGAPTRSRLCRGARR